MRRTSAVRGVLRERAEQAVPVGRSGTLRGEQLESPADGGVGEQASHENLGELLAPVTAVVAVALLEHETLVAGPDAVEPAGPHDRVRRAVGA